MPSPGSAEPTRRRPWGSLRPPPCTTTLAGRLTPERRSRIRSASGDGEVGGLRLDAEGPRPGGPLVLLFSAGLDRTVAAVEGAGGEVVQAPYAFPGGRRFHFRDPSGNELGVWAEA